MADGENPEQRSRRRFRESFQRKLREARERRGGGGSSGQRTVSEESERQEELSAIDIKQEQRRRARAKVGAITRVFEDPKTGERTFVGVGGKRVTFPTKGFTFNPNQPGSAKFGGIPTREQGARTTREAVESLRLGEQAAADRQTAITELIQRKPSTPFSIPGVNERPAQMAARLEAAQSFTEQGEFIPTPFETLREKRKKELIELAGDEATTSQFPQFKTLVDGRVGTVGFQVDPFKEKRGKRQLTEFEQDFIEDAPLFFASRKLVVGVGPILGSKRGTEAIKRFGDKIPDILETTKDVGVKTFARFDETISPFAKQVIPGDIAPKLFNVSDQFREADKRLEKFITIREKETGLKFRGLKANPVTSILEFEGGLVEGLREKPTKTAVSFGIGLAIPPVAGAAGKTISFLLPAKLASRTKLVGSLGILGAAGADVTRRSLASERPFAELGSITSTEVLPIGAGIKQSLKIKGFFATLGREEIPTAQLVPKEVRSGAVPYLESSKDSKLFFEKKAFILERIEKQKGDRFGGITGFERIDPETFEFKTLIPLRGFSAQRTTKETAFTDIMFRRKDIVTEGREYLPGGFTAPFISTSFLGFGKPGQYYPQGSFTFDLFSFGTSRVGAFEAVGVETAPGTTARQVGKFLSGKAKKKPDFGKIFTKDPKIKQEVEGLVIPGQKVRFEKGRFFFRFKDIRVPIEEFTLLRTGIRGKGAKVKIPEFGLESTRSRPPLSIFPGPKSSRISKPPRSSLSSVSKTSLSSLFSSKSSRTSSISSLLSRASRSSSLLSRSSLSSSLLSRTSRGSSSLSSTSRASSSSSSLSSLTTTTTTTGFFPTLRRSKAKKKKKAKRIRIKGRFTPQVRAAGQEIVGKRPRILTGIGFERPLKRLL